MSICTVLFLRIERSSSGLSNTVNSVVSFGRICETQNGHIVIHDTASYLFLYISIYIHIQYDSLKLISNQIAVDCFFTLQWYTKLTSQSSTLYVLLWYGVIHLFLLHYTHSARTSDRTKYWSHKDDIGGKIFWQWILTVDSYRYFITNLNTTSVRIYNLVYKTSWLWPDVGLHFYPARSSRIIVQPLRSTTMQ